MFLYSKMASKALPVLLLSILYTTVSCSGQGGTGKKAPKGKQSTLYDSITFELYKIEADDERYRNQMEETRRQYGGDSKEWKALMKKMQTADSINLLKVTAIIDRYGWLGPDSIGSDGNTTLFMVIQHSNQPTQEKYLPLMREAVKNGRARAKELALLEDRVALEEGKKQIYGSQLRWDAKTNVYAVAPLEDPVNVDKRRAAMGLGPLADYTMECCRLVWNPYGLKTVATMEEYRKLVAGDGRQEIVPLKDLIPGIVLDIRYATADNLMHHPVYTMSAAFLRKPAADALKAVEEELQPLGYGLKVYDGYRPYRVTVSFYEAYHDSNFVASPYTGSRHNRGCAIDLTLVDLKTGQEPEMPTAYDSFTKEAAAGYSGADSAALQNRKLLQEMMLKHGFLLYPSEWWHFDYAGWKDYPVMDIPFEELVKKK